MPRKRPGALRASPPSGPRAHIRGLSARTCHAVHQVEVRSREPSLFRGATVLALRAYARFPSPRGRPLYPRPAPCPSPCCAFDDVRHARDVLNHVLHRLPPRPRAELGRLLEAWDARYLRSTLPDPFASPEAPWWHRRLADGVP
ncbi:hypothetical protein [Nocardiopsis sp. MG754419]|uniref:hypothetical protein n=1 Tax=Nocardiopsis sp. MG754419 TaxID=2259865 RepID=UPI001BA90E66|nr:hypothetical protein [Nocardiopsis sp. MG754419]MBR8742815.1 hypothetical protein [Nocardiopsis sp. MG754419]